jgi:16S rRNA pseudouridine516 synthase
MRLDKFLSNNGFGSRKDVRKIVKNKLVLVNDSLVNDPSIIIDSENDTISVDSNVVHYKKNVYYMLNKPAGYECTHESTLYPSVFELIDDHRTDLIIVGRLDVDTEGLLLMTSDGQFTHQIIHGKKHIFKQYHVELANDFDKNFINELEAGIPFDNIVLKPAKIQVIDEKTIYLSIAEGKYHQVKKMMLYCNNEVVYLKRIAIGDLALDETLAFGEYRELTEDELSLFSI